jgi:hypothetical protein
MGLVCGLGAGSPGCQCPGNLGDGGLGTTVLYVDLSSGGDAGAFPYPNGSLNPPLCRFGSLTDALAAVARLPPADGGLVAQVVDLPLADGGAAVHLLERYPLTVPSGCELTSQNSDATLHVLRPPLDAGGLVVDPGAQADGFTLLATGKESQTAAQTGCVPDAGQTGTSTFSNLVITSDAGPLTLAQLGSLLDGGVSGWAVGVGITTACNANLNTVNVYNAVYGVLAAGASASLSAVNTTHGVAGLAVYPPTSLTATNSNANNNLLVGVYVSGAGSTVSLTGGQVESNGLGVVLDGGSVTLNGVTVASNPGMGVLAGNGGTVTLSGVTETGSAIGLSLSNWAVANVGQSTFDQNGYGIYLGDHTVQLFMDGGVSSNNEGIWVSGGTANLSGVVSRNNQQYADGGAGHGLLASLGAKVNVAQSVFSGNPVGVRLTGNQSSLNMANSQLLANEAGVSVDNGATLTLTNVSETGPAVTPTSPSLGRGLFAKGGSTVSGTGNSFIGNLTGIEVAESATTVTLSGGMVSSSSIIGVNVHDAGVANLVGLAINGPAAAYQVAVVNAGLTLADAGIGPATQASVYVNNQDPGGAQVILSSVDISPSGSPGVQVEAAVQLLSTTGSSFILQNSVIDGGTFGVNMDTGEALPVFARLSDNLIQWAGDAGVVLNVAASTVTFNRNRVFHNGTGVVLGGWFPPTPPFFTGNLVASNRGAQIQINLPTSGGPTTSASPVWDLSGSSCATTGANQIYCPGSAPYAVNIGAPGNYYVGKVIVDNTFWTGGTASCGPAGNAPYVTTGSCGAALTTCP